MSRVAAKLLCTKEQEVALNKLARSRTEQTRLVERAKIVLACLSGKRNDQIADEMKLRPNTVGLWRNRFATQGLAGLHDQARPGKPSTYDHPALRQRILAQLEMPPPAGMSTWDGGLLAVSLSVSADVVWRILRKEGIQLQRHRSWCVSTDPEFSAKSADVIGLYLNPPHNALVLSIDEKPSIQAIERTCGYVHTSSGKIVRAMKSTYKRHGTLNLFAALQVAWRDSRQNYGDKEARGLSGIS